MEVTNNAEYLVSYSEFGNLLWTRGQEKGIPCGNTCVGYAHDGTLQKIRMALLDALTELESEISLWSNHGN